MEPSDGAKILLQKYVYVLFDFATFPSTHKLKFTPQKKTQFREETRDVKPNSQPANSFNDIKDAQR